MNSGFWDHRRVFITGHTGFKGSWLSLWLQSMGAHVTGYSLEPPTCPCLFDVARVGQGMRSHIGDIREHDALVAAMREAKPEVVMHLAAQSQVRPSYADPVATYEANVMGTVNLLDAVRQTPGVRAVVIVTSDKCYENREWPWGYRESEAMGGYDPYSSSKGCAELVTAAYRSSFFNPDHYAAHGVAVGSARAGNVIGGGDWATDRLIPDIVRAIEGGQAVRIRSPNAVRPWQHVLEPLRGYLMLAERLVGDGPSVGGAWNFGPANEDTRPVQWIVERVTGLWGQGARWEIDGMPSPHEATYMKLDASKANAHLGWRGLWSLEIALGSTVAWYKAMYDADDMHAFSLRQIETYEKAFGCH